MKERVEGLNIDVTLLKTGLSYVKLHLVDDSGNALENVLVSGFKTVDNEAIDVFSDSNGNAEGYVSPGSDVTFTIDKMLDIEDHSYKILSAVAGNVYNDTIVLSPTNYRMIVGTTKKYISSYFSHADVELIGGGGGGAGGAYLKLYNYGTVGGGGGGGGNTVYGSFTCEPQKEYTISVGSGGGGGAANLNAQTSNSYLNGAGLDGGQTVAFGLTASGGGGGGKIAVTTNTQTNTRFGGSSENGGSGGTAPFYDGNNNGSASGSKGTNGTQIYHTSFDETAIAAGGGGGGGADVHSSYPGYLNSPNGWDGGLDHGGRGDGYINSELINGANGSVPGGGGGGGRSLNTKSNSTSGHQGGRGACILRFYKDG